MDGPSDESTTFNNVHDGNEDPCVDHIPRITLPAVSFCPNTSMVLYNHVQDLRGWKVINHRIPDDIIHLPNSHMSIRLRRMLSDNKRQLFSRNRHHKVMSARYMANGYEAIGSGIFINRAAMKLAEIDATFNWVFSRTYPISSLPFTNEPTEPGILYFADICGGPGGFTEYMCWRRPYTVKGFGITLKNDKDDFKTELLLECYGANSCFRPIYGADGTGDIYKVHNIFEFVRQVREGTEGTGVHSAMGDGGFCVEGKEDFQEVLSKKLYVAQFLCGLLCLRPGGNLMCKIFDHSTEFTMGLLMLLRMFFKSMAIHKPLCSRPANAERYVVCQCLLRSAKLDQCGLLDLLLLNTSSMGAPGFQLRIERTHEIGVIDKCFLHVINHLVSILSDCNLSPNRDFGAVVPRSLLLSQRAFFNHLKYTIHRLGSRQLRGLQKVNEIILKPRHAEVEFPVRHSMNRKFYLELWRIPDRPRATSPLIFRSPYSILEQIPNLPIQMFKKSISELSMDFCVPSFSSSYSYLVTTSEANCVYVKPLGSFEINNSWIKILNLSFVQRSVLIVEEVILPKSSNIALVVVDILQLDGILLYDVPYVVRHSIIESNVTL
ncbi:hypothetical protein ACOME3_010311 [Neoechinorhynchus agilis]